MKRGESAEAILEKYATFIGPKASKLTPEIIAIVDGDLERIPLSLVNAQRVLARKYEMSVGSTNCLIKNKLHRKPFKKAKTCAGKSKTRKTREETAKTILLGMGKKWKSDDIWYSGESWFGATGSKFDLDPPAILPQAALRL